MTLRGYDDAILHGAVSNDYRRFATASMDATVCIWDSRSEKCAYILNERQRRVKFVAFGNCGHTAVIGGLDHKVGNGSIDRLN